MKPYFLRHLAKSSGAAVHLAFSKSTTIQTEGFRSTLTKSLTRPLSSYPVAPANSFISWEPSVPVKLRMEVSGPGSYPPILVQTMMKNAVLNHPESKAMAIKREGRWQTWTFTQYYEDVRNVAKGFLTLGLERFHGVGIMGANCPEWFISSIGAIFGGGLSCGIYVTNSPAVVTYIVQNSNLDFLVIEEALLKKVLEGRSFEEALPRLKRVIIMDADGEKFFGMDKVMSWKHLLQIGACQSDSILEEMEREQAVNTACAVVYTSGTTGLPKGAMLSHDNVTWTILIAMEHCHFTQETIMSYLPLSHASGLMFDLFMCLRTAGTVCFADKNALKGTLMDNLKEIRPTRFLAVPRIWEKIKERLQEAAVQNSSLKKAISKWAKSAAAEQHQAEREGKRRTESRSYKLAKQLVFK